MLFSIAVTLTLGGAAVNALPAKERLQVRGQSTNSTDWCAQAYNASLQTTYGYFPAPLALKCLQSLPYDQGIAESTIDTVQKMFNQFFAPENYYLRSGNPNVPYAIDIAGGLANISQSIANQELSFFEYQYAIIELIRSLNDGILRE
jgi:hypothetical protein